MGVWEPRLVGLGLAQTIGVLVGERVSGVGFGVTFWL